jgi:hypothetical protein
LDALNGKPEIEYQVARYCVLSGDKPTLVPRIAFAYSRSTKPANLGRVRPNCRQEEPHEGKGITDVRGRPLRGGVAASVAYAQAQLVGQLRDESGGVLPGVTVEAASPAIIEKVRTATTDDQGRYRIEALRPGVYKLTFSLTGFSTVVRDNVDVPSEVVITISADLKVGALEETITVSGETPQVDVQQASRTQVITREIIDTLPISRNVMSIGVLSPGVRQGTPDIGGSRMTEQVGLRAHGLGGNDAEQLVEGMSIQSLEGAEAQVRFVHSAVVEA